MDRGRPELRAIIDTNVVAYLVLGTQPHVEEARRFFASLQEGYAPSHWEAELANVLWMATRHKVLPADEGIVRLELANSLGIHSVPSRALWQGALVRAQRSGVAVYDTLFVELAVREDIPLVTFDKVLLKSFPDIAVPPAALIGQ